MRRSSAASKYRRVCIFLLLYRARVWNLHVKGLCGTLQVRTLTLTASWNDYTVIIAIAWLNNGRTGKSRFIGHVDLTKWDRNVSFASWKYLMLYRAINNTARARYLRCSLRSCVHYTACCTIELPNVTEGWVERLNCRKGGRLGYKS